MKKIAIFLILLAGTFTCFAAEIYLKNGKKVQGKIIEQTDYFVKIDFEGIPLTYWKYEIDKIAEDKPEVKVDKEATVADEKAYLRKIMEIASMARNLCESKMVIDGQEVNFAPKSDKPAWKNLRGYYEGKKAVLENLQREFEKLPILPQFRQTREEMQKSLDYAINAYAKAIEALEKDDITILNKEAVSLLNQAADSSLNVVYSLKKLNIPQN
jgi:sRNA-binding regulator protein Hfq